MHQDLWLDIALRILHEPIDILESFVKSLIQTKNWDALQSLFKHLHLLQAFQNPEMVQTAAEGLKNLPTLWGSLLESDNPNEKALKELHPALVLVLQLASYAADNTTLLKLLDQCERPTAKLNQQAEKSVGERQYEKLQRNLELLRHQSRVGPGAEKGWKLLKQERGLSAPAECVQKYLDQLPIERTMEMARALLQENIIPETVIQRKNIFRFLFGKTYITQDIDPALGKAYAEKEKEALTLAGKVGLEWLSAPGGIEDKLKLIYRLQCLLPANALSEFCAAFLEMRRPDLKTPEEKIQKLIQAELQLPTALDIYRDQPNLYMRLVKLERGLEEFLLQQRVEAYIEDSRGGTSLPFLLRALQLQTKWAAGVLQKHAALLQKELRKKDADFNFQFFFCARRLCKDLPGELQNDLKRLADKLYGEANEVLADNHRPQFQGLLHLFRHMALGQPTAEIQEMLKTLKERLKQETQLQLQQLAFKVGDALGEAMSKSSIITIPAKGENKGTEIGERLTRLYDLFKDVLLQQDPFEKKTHKTLSSILDEAESLIKEADSIHQSKASTVYERLIENPKSVIRGLLMEGDESILSAINTRYLENEVFLSRTFKNGETKRVIPEHLLMRNFSRILTELVTREIASENNPLILQIGQPLEDFINFGIVDLQWWGKDETALQASTLFEEASFDKEPIIINDRFVISHLMDWIRFENEEALKITYRKGMSVVCTYLTDSVVSCRRLADNLFKDLVFKLGEMGHGGLAGILVQLRKATYQVNSLELLKSSGFLPPTFDRSIEPRVRHFVDGLSLQFASFDKPITALLRETLPKVYTLDRHEFRLGMVLKNKERSLKKYLHANLEDLTRNYLREAQRNSIPAKIDDVCIRVQQGINTRKGDMRNLRYSPVYIGDEGKILTPSAASKMITAFEENFPIIDRITGSRQTVDSEVLIFKAERDGLKAQALLDYLDKVDRYLDNAQKLARQLRIVIIPGVGGGSYEESSNCLCLPLRTGASRTHEMSLLSALSDYLFHIKFVNESSENEEEVLQYLNKKGKMSLRAGTSDARIKITDFIFRELCALCDIKAGPLNPAALSSILVKHILGTDNTIIYRELRNLSAIQKQERFDILREKYRSLRRGVPASEGVMDYMLTLMKQRDSVPERKQINVTRMFHTLNELEQYVIKDELYDLAVLMYHYRKFDGSYEMFEFLTQLDPQFAEAFWGMGTSLRSAEITIVGQHQRISIAVQAFRKFAQFKNVGAFWKKRANDLVKNLDAAS